MNNTRPLMKRVCAYTIDLIIVMIIASLLSRIPILNKGMEDYQKTYKEYETEYTKYSDYLNLLEESYKDELIDDEEYTKLIDSELHKEKIISRYEDNEISEEEYNKITSEINKELDTIARNYIYILNKKSVSSSIITLTCTLLYFGIFQYLLKGQTIGKKIFKLKVVSSSDKKINIFNYILRSLIITDVLLNAIGITFLILATRTVYTQANNVISILVSLAEAVTIFLVLTREDQRGLHDLLFNTKVISTEINNENNIELIDNTKIIEAEIEEPKKKTKVDEKKNKKRKRKE